MSQFEIGDIVNALEFPGIEKVGKLVDVEEDEDLMDMAVIEESNGDTFESPVEILEEPTSQEKKQYYSQ